MKIPALTFLALIAGTAVALAIDPPPGGGYPNDVTALGTNALFSSGNIYPSDNTAVGFDALYSDAGGGTANTAVGSYAMISNTIGFANVAAGYDALAGNSTGHSNVAIGSGALVANTTGVLNVAVGYNALSGPITGSDNVAIGNGVMSEGTTGTYNTAIGDVAMAFSTGSENVAVGNAALNQSSGSQNIGIGQSACLNVAGNNNIGIGQYAAQNVTTGANNIVVGQNAGQNITTGSNNIEIANQGGKKDSGFIRIGDAVAQKKTFIAGISGVTVASGVGVVVASNGQLGVMTSSARYKEAIQPMAQSSEARLSLKPVTFRYKKELDPEAIPQFGLVAEQVAKVDPNLVARDESGKPYTVRYEAVNAMLLNEFLKEHRKVENLEAALAQQQAEIKTLIDGLQKVSAQMQRKQDAPRLVSAGD